MLLIDQLLGKKTQQIRKFNWDVRFILFSVYYYSVGRKEPFLWSSSKRRSANFTYCIYLFLWCRFIMAFIRRQVNKVFLFVFLEKIYCIMQSVPKVKCSKITSWNSIVSYANRLLPVVLRVLVGKVSRHFFLLWQYLYLLVSLCLLRWIPIVLG